MRAREHFPRRRGGDDSFIEFIPGFSADGNQHVGMSEGYFLWQDTAVGNRTGWTDPANVSTYARYNFSPTGLDAGAPGSLALAGANASGLAADTFGDMLTLTYNTGAVAPSGNIGIFLGAGGTARSHFDNVRLDATPIPEPSVGILAGLAGLVLLRRRCWATVNEDLSQESRACGSGFFVAIAGRGKPGYRATQR
jgi:hypothetical protein